MSAAPTITAIAPWFGGKRTLAPRIVAELGEHRCYWEPFCGSMAVLLAKPYCSMETVNDLHGDLINLARCIQHPTLGPQLYRRLRRTMMSEVMHNEAAERYRLRGRSPAPAIADLDRAYDYFLTAWFGRNGVAGTQSYNQGFCRRFTVSGGGPSKRYCGAVESIPAWRRRMRDVTILSGDAFSLIERIEDREGIAIYCDPPYVEKGAKYVHDFSTDDHARLAELLTKFTKSRVVVSYYEHDSLRGLYRGWSFVPCPVSKSLASAGRRGVKNDAAAPEVLIINGPSLSAGGLFGGAA